jgi:hypothetical protein
MSNVFGGRNRTRLLLASGTVAAPLFVATFLIEGARCEGYESIRLPAV